MEVSHRTNPLFITSLEVLVPFVLIEHYPSEYLLGYVTPPLFRNLEFNILGFHFVLIEYSTALFVRLHSH